MWQSECQRGTENCDRTWHAVDFNSVMIAEASVAEADVTNTGTFKVVHKPNPGPIIALTVAVFAFVGALAWVLLNKCGDRCPTSLQRFQLNKDQTGIQIGKPVPPPFTNDGKTVI